MRKKIILQKQRLKRGRKKLTIKEMHLLAKSRGGECLSTKYINASTKLEWKCKNGHTFKMTPHHVKEGRWCLKCSNKIRGRGHKLTIEEIQQIAEKNGGECISTKYINNTIKLKWKCAKGHEFEMTPSYVKSGGWCPTCKTKKSQEPRAKSQEQ
ncbi:hypothetical protein ACFL56_02920 [Candidatus Margulisiibacteriota bacterium]